MMTIEAIQKDIIDEFAAYDDWMDKYQLLIEMGSAMPPLSAADKSPEHLIDGCQSRVWLVGEEQDGILTFRADSDALIVKGIIALLLRVVNGQAAAAILSCDMHFLDVIGLHEHLSPTRANGLVAMLQQIRAVAAAALTP